jgi:aryl-alcohol dehydrogenase-like predicted oxidoreductase
MSKMLYGQIPYIKKPISRLVHGTVMISMGKKDEAFKLLDGMTSIGVNTFDSAAVYGDGERVLGVWMQERGNREQIVILTKGAHHNAWRKRVTPYDIKGDVHDSLAKLMSDYIDLYILHRDDPDVAAGPIVEVLNELHNEGKIHAFGGSNWTHKRLEEANEYAYKHNLIPFLVSSPNYGLAQQLGDPWGPGCVSISGPKEVEARNWYAKTELPIFAYSSLGRGLFSGLIKSTSPEKLGEIFGEPTLKGYSYPENFKRLERVEKMALEKNLTVPQVAMAWLMKQPLNVFALVGANSMDEMRQNIDALHVNLTQEELDWLDLKIAAYN